MFMTGWPAPRAKQNPPGSPGGFEYGFAYCCQSVVVIAQYFEFVNTFFLFTNVIFCVIVLAEMFCRCKLDCFQQDFAEGE
jgi:hypothetical protein